MADYQFKTKQVVNLRWSQEAPSCITLCDFTAALGPNMHCVSHQSKTTPTDAAQNTWSKSQAYWMLELQIFAGLIKQNKDFILSSPFCSV